MKPKVKTLWVEALRSGKYKQGTGRLKGRSIFDDTARHCCLGVLCEIAIEQGVDIPVRTFKPSDTFITYRFGEVEEEEFLPGVVGEWAGLEVCNPEVELSEGEIITIADLNDGGYSFDEISDLISEQL